MNARHDGEEKLVNTNTKHSLKHNFSPIHPRGDITINYVKQWTLRSPQKKSLNETFHFHPVSLAYLFRREGGSFRRTLTCSSKLVRHHPPPSDCLPAYRPPEGLWNNYRAQLKNSRKIVLHFFNHSPFARRPGKDDGKERRVFRGEGEMTW